MYTEQPCDGNQGLSELMGTPWEGQVLLWPTGKGRERDNTYSILSELLKCRESICPQKALQPEPLRIS